MAVSYLIVGAGGGGGNGNSSVANSHAGGGGGGEVQTGSWNPSSTNSYTVTIGTGASATAGGDTTVSGVDFALTSKGGAAGGNAGASGGNGGSHSGGGGGGAFGNGGSGKHNGGNAAAGSTYTAAAGGGAGDAADGSAGVGVGGSGIGGSGGAGTSSSISGSSLSYGGGAGGAAQGTQGPGSFTGGDGALSAGGGIAPVAGLANRGGGGGGGCETGASTALPGAAGGSGVVIFSYPTGSLQATGGSITTSGGNTIHTFNSNGTFQVLGFPINVGGAPLVLTGGTPFLLLSSPIIRPTSGSLVLSGSSPSLFGFGPGTGHLVLSGGTPTMIQMVVGRPFVTIAGVDQTNNIEWDSVIIRDVLNQPSTCSFVTLYGYHPAEGSSVIFWRDGVPIFAGAVTTTQQVYGGQPVNLQFNVSCIDGNFFLRKRYPFGTYTNVSASFVAGDLISRYSTFSPAGVQANLPNITIIFDGSDDLSQCLTSICKLIGGNFFTGDNNLIYLFTPSGAPTVTSITDASTNVLNDPQMMVTIDYTQIRTRINVKGAQVGTLAADVSAGETIVPISDVSALSTSGGDVLAAPNNIIPYTGVITNAVGSLTGPGVAPTQSPTVAIAKGSGLNLGNYLYAEVFVTPQGKSTPGPVASIATQGVTTQPDPVTAMGVNQYDNYWNVSGTAPNYNATGQGPKIGDTVQYSYSFSTSVTPDLLHDTNLAPASPVVTVRAVSPFSLPAGWTVACAPFVIGAIGPTDRINILNGDTNWIHVWRKLNGGAWILWQTFNALSVYYNGFYFTDSQDPIGGSPPSPNATIAAKQQVSVTPFTGPSGVTSREIYRTVAGGSALLLVHTYGDNTDITPFVDSTPDGSLGAAAPTGDTSGLPFAISNGGGFYSTGVTFPTDGAATLATSAAPVLTSASYTFVAADVGAYIVITAGTNWITGRYLITSVAAGAATVVGPIAGVASPTAGTWGIDYSTLTNARISFTDMVIDATTATKFTSAAHPVGVNFIGNVIAVNNSIGFISQRVIVKSTSGTVATCDKNLGTLSSTGGSGNLGGAPPPTSTPAGSTSIQIRDTSQFPTTGGWVSDGNQQIRYTGVQTTQAQSTLTGIPTSGPGSITTAIAFGTTLTQLAAITGCSNVPALTSATSIRLFVVVDSLSAQASLAVITNTDGIFESPIDDSTLPSIAACVAAGNADLGTFSTAVVTVDLCIRDINYHSGKVVTINRTTPPVQGTFTIQDITVTQVWVPAGPLFTVKVSNMKFTLQDLLAQIVNFIQAGGTL